MALYKIHSIPMSSTRVTRQLGMIWDFSGGNTLYWYGAEPYRSINAILLSMGNVWAGFCQIRSNSIVKGHRS